jgi:hypothetical protein
MEETGAEASSYDERLKGALDFGQYKHSILA